MAGTCSGGSRVSLGRNPLTLRFSFGKTVRFARYDGPMNGERDIRADGRKQGCGRVIIPPDVNVWPHELNTADALARAGYVVEFVRKNDTPHEKTADALVDGVLWEFKAPRSSHLGAVERNLKKGRRQSKYIVFDGRRMKGIPDHAIEREVRALYMRLKNVDKVLYVNKHGQIVDIK